MSLDDFLNRGAGEPAPAAEKEPVPQTPPEPETPAEQPAPETETPEAPEGEPEETDAGGNLGKALAAERAQRRDWKEKAIRAEEAAKARDRELAEIRKQLEEMKRPAPPPPQQPMLPPNPAEQPDQFLSYVQQQVLNERLNTSEMLARREHGAEAVDKAVEEFRSAVAQNPALQAQLYQQPDPYGWVMQQVETMRLQREIGSNPAAWREQQMKAMREQILAEMQGQQPAAPQPRVNLPPSLAGARSAAPRSAPSFSGPTPIGDILSR